MARIQIMELPALVVGEFIKTPFAIVIDQVESDSVEAIDGTVLRRLIALTQTEADLMAQRVGAEGAILAACTLDVIR